jgi:putative ABC transport system permease protein
VNASGLVTPARASEYHARLNERIAALPAVRRATLAQLGPLTSATTVGSVEVSPTSSAPEADRIVRMFFVGPDYFETLGMPLVAGRGILDADTNGRERVAVVNQRFALFFFGSPQDALGRIVNKDVRIIGVAADAHYNSPRDDVPRAMFVPYTPMQRTQMTHIVRASGDTALAMRAVRETIASYDSHLRPRISTSEDLFLAALARERFFSAIATTLSSLALLLACAGLYAAVAYGVAQRRAEIAVRLALGASTRNVMSLVLKDPLVTIGAGVLAGIPVAYAAMRSLATLLFGVGSFEPLTVISCTAALVVVGMLAAAIPARRACRIDPAAVLRNG